jgi:hypothetical protein
MSKIYFHVDMSYGEGHSAPHWSLRPWMGLGSHYSVKTKNLSDLENKHRHKVPRARKRFSATSSVHQTSLTQQQLGMENCRHHILPCMPREEQ